MQEHYRHLYACMSQQIALRENQAWVKENCTGRIGWMAHRKWKEIKRQPSILPGPAVPGSCLVSFHFLWAIHPIRPVNKLNELGTTELPSWKNTQCKIFASSFLTKAQQKPKIGCHCCKHTGIVSLLPRKPAAVALQASVPTFVLFSNIIIVALRSAKVVNILLT